MVNVDLIFCKGKKNSNKLDDFLDFEKSFTIFNYFYSKKYYWN